MKIVSTNVFVGPNVWARFPVIRHVVDLGVLEEWPSARIGEEFISGLIAALPGLDEHGCSYREPGGFIRRMREDEGTWMAHIWEHVALELQNEAGSSVSFGRTRGAGPVGQYNMVFQYKSMDGRTAFWFALKLMLISLFAMNWVQFNAVASALISGLDQLAGGMVAGLGGGGA